MVKLKMDNKTNTKQKEDDWGTPDRTDRPMLIKPKTMQSKLKGYAK